MGTKGKEGDKTTVDVVEEVDMVANGEPGVNEGPVVNVEVELPRKNTNESTRRILDLLRERRGTETNNRSTMRVRKNDRVRGLLRSRRSRRTPKDPSN